MKKKDKNKKMKMLAGILLVLVILASAIYFYQREGILFSPPTQSFQGELQIAVADDFEDGIANAIRGDVVDERLGYMDSEGEFGGLEPEKDSKTLDDYFTRDLKLKEILANIKVGI